MKHGDNAIAPSYNVQVSTDAKGGVIVGVDLTQHAEDSAQLLAAMNQVHNNLGRDAQQVVADGGFTNRQTIEKMEERNIDFIGSLPDSARALGSSGEIGGHRAAMCAALFHLATGNQHAGVACRQTVGLCRAKPQEAQPLPPISSLGGRLPELPLPAAAVLSAVAAERANGIATGIRK